MSVDVDGESRGDLAVTVFRFPQAVSGRAVEDSASPDSRVIAWAALAWVRVSEYTFPGGMKVIGRTAGWLSSTFPTGRVHCRRNEIAADRVDHLARLPTVVLEARYSTGNPSVECIVETSGLAYEIETVARRDAAAELHMIVTVTDLPYRRRSVGDGFQKREDGTIGARIAVMHFGKPVPHAQKFEL